MFVRNSSSSGKAIRFSITNGLLVSYVLIYLLQRLVGESYSIMQYGMNGMMVLEKGEYYRLITSAFMHGSLGHLLMNCQFIYFIGNIVENILGRWRYVVLIIVSVLCASGAVLLSDWFNYPGSLTIGASGFGYGLIGALVAFSIIYPQRYYGNIVKSLMQNILVTSIFFLLLGANISWSGHIGGFIGGMLTIAFLNMFFRRKIW